MIIRFSVIGGGHLEFSHENVDKQIGNIFFLQFFRVNINEKTPYYRVSIKNKTIYFLAQPEASSTDLSFGRSARCRLRPECQELSSENTTARGGDKLLSSDVCGHDGARWG